MLESVNQQLERFMPFITPVSVIIGVLFADHLVGFSFLVPWIFAFITFSGSLNSNFSSLKGALKSPLPLIIILFLLHVIMPIIAWMTGHLIFKDDHLTEIGLVIGVIIPTGITSIMWVSIYKGSSVLALTIILIDTLLSPLIVPYTLTLIVDQKVEMDMLSLMYGLLFMVVFPSLLGMLINQLTKGRSVKLQKTFSPFSKLALAIVVMINGSAVAPYLREVNLKLLMIAITVFFLAFLGYFLAWMIGKWLKRDRETIIVMMYTGGMRNISAGAVLAVQYFPAAIAVVVIIGMLFQQVLASIFGFLFKSFEDRADKKDNHMIAS
jgi:bile acid:Na+ symporter, BASS family